MTPWRFETLITATHYIIMTTNAFIKSSFYLKLLMMPPLAINPPHSLPTQPYTASAILSLIVENSERWRFLTKKTVCNFCFFKQFEIVHIKTGERIKAL